MVAAAWLLLLFPAGATAESALPYRTYYKDGYGQLVETQAAYIPGDIIGRFDGSASIGLNQPKDLFVDERDHIYIADTNNNRIVHLDEQGGWVRDITLPDSPFNRPSGLFVTGQGDIYVADTGNARVVRLDSAGRLRQQFTRPDTEYLPDSFRFEPVNLVVDKRGFLYITTLGAFQGLVQLTPEGEFQSFFGANRVAFSLFDAFKRAVYTREMYQRELKKLPAAVAAVTLDRDGFVYTVTKEIASDQVKKLNIAGLNQLPGKADFSFLHEGTRFGELLYRGYNASAPQLSDVTVDDAGNITVIDSLWNMISRYDRSGNLLFFWGGDIITATSKTGVVKTAAAIDHNSAGELLVLDSVNGFIQVLRPSEFGALVLEANERMQAGLYADSERVWEQVYRLHDQYTPALIGLAKAAYNREDYGRAQTLFARAGIVGGYSESFWQNRLVWFQEHFNLLMNGVVGLAVVSVAWRRTSRKFGWRRRLPGAVAWLRKSRLIGELLHIGALIRHPLDGFYSIRYEQKVGWFTSLFVFAAALAAFSYMQAGTNFVFRPEVVVGVDLLPVTVQFAALWFGWVVSNYLISSLMRGEGRFRDVWQGSSFALFPIVLIGIPLTALSGALTLNEQSIFQFLEWVAYGWTVLMFVWMVQGIHNYTLPEALLNIALTLAALLMIVIMLFILLSLSVELIHFINSLYQEVIIR